jgi:hypothetical protein
MKAQSSRPVRSTRMRISDAMVIVHLGRVFLRELGAKPTVSSLMQVYSLESLFTEKCPSLRLPLASKVHINDNPRFPTYARSYE